MAEIAVKSVLAVADLPRRDVRFDLIKLTVASLPPLDIDENGRKTGGHFTNPRSGVGQGFFAPADAEDPSQRAHLPADMSVRASEAENEA